MLRWASKTTASLLKWSLCATVTVLPVERLTSSWTVLSIFGYQTQNHSYSGNNTEKIQSLKVWEPPEWCLAFFWSVSPLLTDYG